MISAGSVLSFHYSGLVRIHLDSSLLKRGKSSLFILANVRFQIRLGLDLYAQHLAGFIHQTFGNE